MFKVIVAGCRDYTNYEEAVQKILECTASIPKDNLEIVSGMARGADTLGLNYAINNKIKYSQFPADWNKFGKSAGYKRNEQMAQYGNALLAFWDGQSRGTKHMIDLAKQYGLKVRVFNIVTKEWFK